MSRPVQNAGPSPLSTSARTPADSASSYAAVSSASAFSSSALRLSGAFSATRATAPSIARSIIVSPSLCDSDVVVHDDTVGARMRLAGQHVAALELVGFERVV